MAGITKKGDAYYCSFRHGGRRYNFTIGKVTEREAVAKSTEVDETLRLVNQGRITLPDGADFCAFVAAGGKVPTVPAAANSTLARPLFDDFLAAHEGGSVEANSLVTLRVHLNQIASTLGERYRLAKVTLLDIQRHVDRRQKAGIAPATIKKEITTFRACWAWGVDCGRLKSGFPGKGLRLPREAEKEPFRSFADITAVVADDRTAEQWESLYLTLGEMAEFLAHVEAKATQPWVYPMVACAAFTGARRSELLRMQAGDVDLAGGTITIREKKRVRGKGSTRTVPLPNRLKTVLRGWVAARPVCPFLFCQGEWVSRSKTRRTTATRVTCNEAHDHFRRTVAGSKWSVVKGWHVLRHSFISALASRGVDQRVIDEMVGHQSEEQRQRYRHLYPEVMREAVGRVFG